MKVIPSFYIKLHILPYTITTEYIEIKNTVDHITNNFKIKNGQVVIPKPKTKPLIEHIKEDINKIIKKYCYINILPSTDFMDFSQEIRNFINSSKRISQFHYEKKFEIEIKKLITIKDYHTIKYYFTPDYLKELQRQHHYYLSKEKRKFLTFLMDLYDYYSSGLYEKENDINNKINDKRRFKHECPTKNRKS